MKMIGTKYKNLGRLKDALVSNACQNQIDQFEINYNAYKMNCIESKNSPFKDKLMDFAMMSLSDNIVELLIKDGSSCNYNSCLYECNYDLSDKVYLLINKMIDKYGPFTKNTIHMHKGMIINRIIDPEKASINPKRLEYVIELVRSGFLEGSEVKSVADELYKDSKHKGNFSMVTRELILTSLGI